MAAVCRHRFLVKVRFVRCSLVMGKERFTVICAFLQGVFVPAGGVVTLSGRLSTQPCVLQPLIQKL